MDMTTTEYEITVTYEEWTAEDVSLGEPSDRGFLFENSEEETLEDVVCQLQSLATWLDWSSSHPADGDWISSQEEVDPYTGTSVVYNAFVSRPCGEALSQAEIAALSKALGI